MKNLLYLFFTFCISTACISHNSNNDGNKYHTNNNTFDDVYSLLSGDSVKAWYAVNKGEEGFLFFRDSHKVLHLAYDTSVYMACNQILGEIYEYRDSCLLFLTHNPIGNYGFDIGKPQYVSEQYKVCYISEDSMILEYNKKRQLYTPISMDIVNRNRNGHKIPIFDTLTTDYIQSKVKSSIEWAKNKHIDFPQHYRLMIEGYIDTLGILKELKYVGVTDYDKKKYTSFLFELLKQLEGLHFSPETINSSEDAFNQRIVLPIAWNF